MELMLISCYLLLVLYFPIPKVILMLGKRIRNSRFKSKMASFNMTPMIDVVFLLIVFFMLICQFISQDNERLAVPDNCSTAIDDPVNMENEIVIQVWSRTGNKDNVVYSIGQSDFYLENDDQDSSTKLIMDISQSLKDSATGMKNPVIRLRGDGSLSCSQVRPAIKAAATAGLANIRFAAFKDSDQEVK